MGVSENSGVFRPNHPLKNRDFQYFHHPFWGTTIFGNTHTKILLDFFLIVFLALEIVGYHFNRFALCFMKCSHVSFKEGIYLSTKSTIWRFPKPSNLQFLFFGSDSLTLGRFHQGPPTFPNVSLE